MIFWFLPSFFSFDLSSAQYISEFVCCLIPHSIISQLYNTIPFSSRWLISPKLSKQSYSYGVYIVCIVVPNTAYTFLAFHSCHVSFPHMSFQYTSGSNTTFIVPTPLQCHLYCYIVLISHFLVDCCIEVILIDGWYYMHQHLIVYHYYHPPRTMTTSSFHVTPAA